MNEMLISQAGKNEKQGELQQYVDGHSPKPNEKYLSEMRRNAEKQQSAQKLVMMKAGVAQN